MPLVTQLTQVIQVTQVTEIWDGQMMSDVRSSFGPKRV
jgi:hypothetical protein